MKDATSKTCGLCGHESSDLSRVAEDYIFDLIRKNHPEWVRADGACPKCLVYYSTLEDVIQIAGKEGSG